MRLTHNKQEFKKLIFFGISVFQLCHGKSEILPFWQDKNSFITEVFRKRFGSYIVHMQWYRKSRLQLYLASVTLKLLQPRNETLVQQQSQREMSLRAPEFKTVGTSELSGASRDALRSLTAELPAMGVSLTHLPVPQQTHFELLHSRVQQLEFFLN